MGKKTVTHIHLLNTLCFIFQILILLVMVCMSPQTRFNILYAQEIEDIDSLNKQVINLYEEGKYEEAISIAKKILEENEEKFGIDHSVVEISINNLAALYRMVGNYTEAEPLFWRVLEIRENTLGPDHPDTAISIDNLAALYQAMGNYYAKTKPYQANGYYSKSESLYRRALEIRENTLGPDHPDTKTSITFSQNIYRW